MLDLQGGVEEHLDHLERIGITGVRVKDSRQLSGLAGLIIPGGESTCLGRLMRIFGLMEPIVREYQQGMRLWGTCAGAILLAAENIGEPSHLGLIDITIERNAFGSQINSFITEAIVPRVADCPLPLTFIRAPKILRAGSDVEILLRIDDYIAAAENEKVLVTVFHPELTSCLEFHRYFARKCNVTLADEAKATPIDPAWNRQGWMRYSRICPAR